MESSNDQGQTALGGCQAGTDTVHKRAKASVAKRCEDTVK